MTGAQATALAARVRRGVRVDRAEARPRSPSAGIALAERADAPADDREAVKEGTVNRIALSLACILLIACSADDTVDPEPLEYRDLYDLVWSPTSVAPGCELELPDLLAVGTPSSSGYQDTTCYSWGAAVVIYRDEDLIAMSGAIVAGCDDRVAKIHQSDLVRVRSGDYRGDVEVVSGWCTNLYAVTASARP